MKKTAALFYTFDTCLSAGSDDEERGIGPFMVIQADEHTYWDRFEEIIGDTTCYEIEVSDSGTKRPLVRGKSPYMARDSVYVHYLDGSIRHIRFSEIKYSKMVEEEKARKINKEQEKKRKDLEKLTQKALSSLPRYINDAWCVYRKYFRDPSGKLMCFQFEKVYPISSTPFYRIVLEPRSTINPEDLTKTFAISKADFDKAKKELDAYLEGKDS